MMQTIAAHEAVLRSRLRAAFAAALGRRAPGAMLHAAPSAGGEIYQALHPPASWNWPPSNPGFISAAQYDFCATIPQWSEEGTYVSSGVTFDRTYQQFLNLVVLYTTNPQLQRAIQAAQNALLVASANLQNLSAESRGAYNATVKDNDPSYTQWLDGDGKRFGTQLRAATGEVDRRQSAVNDLLAQQQTPHIAGAQAAFADPANYLALSGSGLAGMPPVPAWNVSSDVARWLTEHRAGKLPRGSIAFSNEGVQPPLVAARADDPADAFWAVSAGGAWQHADAFYADAELTCRIEFSALDVVAIEPGAWYSGTNLFQAGPFYWDITPYEPTPPPVPSSQLWMFGRGGLIPLMKTAMQVAYEPAIAITVGDATYRALAQRSPRLSGVQVGSLRVGGPDAGATIRWTRTGGVWQLTATAPPTVPLIVGVVAAVQPAAAHPA